MDVIELIIKNLSLSIDKYESASMAVPGGTSPIKIFDKLSKQKLDWSKVQITLVDDRLVDTDNEHSNQKLIRNYLLKNEAQISNFIPLNKNLHKDNNFKFPLDICYLGIGNDGHFASLFPNMINNTNTLDPKSKLNINEIKGFIELFSGSELFSEEIYFFSNLPVIIDSNQIIIISTISLLLSFLATIYPSIKASKIEPINLIKWE